MENMDPESPNTATLKQLDFDNDTTMKTNEATHKTQMDLDDEEDVDEDNDLNTNIKAEQFDVEISEEDLESIAIMIDELMKDDPAVRIKAIRSLPIISKALGEERTRNELIPYITQMIDDDDEVLLVLIEEIYRLLTLKLIGGASSVNNPFSFCLIPPFERLCQVEEKIIRDEATNKFGKIIYNMPYKHKPFYFHQYILPLFNRLCHCDWNTARMSGATLIANAFSKFVELLNELDADNETEEATEERERLISYKKDMLLLLSELCSDSLPIVRRSAIITLGKMVACLDGRNATDKQQVLSQYLPLFKKLSGDDQDNVRVFAVETLIQFSDIFDKSEVVSHLLYHIRLLCIDQAWRVRYIAADNFIKLCQMLDSQCISDSMINYFIRLLQDQEAEVRAVAISKIPEMSTLIGKELSITKLIPIISKELVCDSNKYARASLASIIIPFCYLLPHQVVIEHILSCILCILKDEYPNVRLHVISNICSDNNNGKGSDFDISLLEESIIPSIMELTLDNDWRVRLGIIDKFPALAKQFGLAFFNERLFDLCLASLEDNVSDIRLSAASNLFEISRIFEESEQDDFGWTRQKLIPSLVAKMYESKNYLHRLIYLLAFKYLSEGLGVKQNSELIQEIIHFMACDKVPNVRFKACQIVTFLAKNKLIRRQFMEGILDKLQVIVENDDDIDVVYFANQSIDALENSI